MLTHPTRPDHFLVTAADLEPASPGSTLPPAVAARADALRSVLDWARTYLTEPHPDLGRAGPVCPFVGSSLREERFHLAVRPGRPADRAAVAEAVALHREWFLLLAPPGTPRAQSTTILVVFPDLPSSEAPELIDRTQLDLKTAFVEDGLMLGQFHDLPPEQPGLWNPDFRPLRSPLPMLVIRHMVPTDLPFLVEDPRHRAAYQRLFGHRGQSARRRVAS
ncbi:hypothetical protein C7C46_03690 [Streptomyces tateyamensis]|uniref:DUF6875 domain-containing protein n=1 Tax=Streptomyces tateyamensis TaxID=565073 RepID=A0A2V4P9N1_9ACTN|nr:hypothetical protein [Streptomyces tateyamensis]PYC87632.1 hypothetical protein C7C46_03690 [Streptomyces tateyamensis]